MRTAHEGPSDAAESKKGYRHASGPRPELTGNKDRVPIAIVGSPLDPAGCSSYLSRAKSETTEARPVRDPLISIDGDSPSRSAQAKPIFEFFKTKEQGRIRHTNLSHGRCSIERELISGNPININAAMKVRIRNRYGPP